MKERINDKTIEELEKIFLDLGFQKFRAKQVFRQIHVNKINDFSKMTDLSKDMREKLDQLFSFPKIKILKEFKSKVDKTKKFLLELDDGNIIEAVFMEYDNRNTICISSQVGCKMGCKFCASTKNGLERSLSASEIIEEIYLLERENSDINNIVVMGIGEPLDNFSNIERFIKIITDLKGRNLSHRSITVSTVGLVDKIYELSDLGYDINLAVSLHYAFDKKRMIYMPSAKKYKINEIVKACDYYLEKTKRRVSYEYVVIDGVNNLEEDVDQLVKLFKGKNIHINLIPLNPIEEFKHSKTKANIMEEFQKKLTQNGLNATSRRSMGSDIDASCGQLRNNYAR
ncbi:MAG: 23S rRNA (adenine(2503)-C(2))-methyltransferase RlmN [Anaerococcus vaginalis]|nr:23S rRNA methyltransferase [Anaerococcus hydrogenalis]MDU2829456.1 23S rRNA (adenine(2503)-C(2))-methyltransferase RlmN [Anaerococcus sp.]MDU5913846.1 23S rRNA (adenine(2503)-C(2))-methyltransferase RlmN [Anaerococcus vaginalis]